ncbi:hypothetical protein BJ508DRAFT_323400 [Ascobolus immersus RN42]|uniref:Mif2 N-terminal domain-containing protein n=1 Tax=Ascobolus immersus RN42 TaxID=1160509 RepID=A0A3N4IJG9_ASCIM|nr:hypothetical protein BJ508DRAFT_323400 [Ascobolus immersus RN42]
MATAAAAGRQNRGNQFTALGIAGRKTGISIKDTGKRNEDGLEDMSNFFSPTPSVRHSSLPAEAEDEDEEEEVGEEAGSKSMDLVTSTAPLAGG